MMIAEQKIHRFKDLLCRLGRDKSGLALVEFAVSLPFFMGLSISGFEVANYALTHLRLNQLTINVADGAARMGEGNPLEAKRITELMINDVFAGTIREGNNVLLDAEHPFIDPSDGDLKLRGNARIIISSVEAVEVTLPNGTKENQYHIAWQRCVGKGSQYNSNFGKPGDAPKTDGIGPSGRKIMASDNSAVMFAELQYFFRPIILNGFSRLTERTIQQTAAMIVRDDRDYSQIYNPQNVAISACTAGTGIIDDS